MDMVNRENFNASRLYHPKTKEELKALCEDEFVNLGDIDTSKITDMSYLFQYSNRKDFSGIETWNTSNVKNMEMMFYKAVAFNHPIGNWDVSNVKNMEEMFSFAEQFNQDIGGWDVSNVTNMHRMFAYAEKFNQSLDKWNVSNVNDMSSMFMDAIRFNQPLNDWNVSNVKTMKAMFCSAHRFNQPLDKWDVSNVEDFRLMFKSALSFNQPIKNWNISDASKIDGIFMDAMNFASNQKIPRKWLKRADYHNPKISAQNGFPVLSYYIDKKILSSSVLESFCSMLKEEVDSEARLVRRISKSKEDDEMYVFLNGKNGGKISVVSSISQSADYVYGNELKLYVDENTTFKFYNFSQEELNKIKDKMNNLCKENGLELLEHSYYIKDSNVSLYNNVKNYCFNRSDDFYQCIYKTSLNEICNPSFEKVGDKSFEHIFVKPSLYQLKDNVITIEGKNSDGKICQVSLLNSDMNKFRVCSEILNDSTKFKNWLVIDKMNYVSAYASDFVLADAIVDGKKQEVSFNDVRDIIQNLEKEKSVQNQAYQHKELKDKKINLKQPKEKEQKELKLER